LSFCLQGFIPPVVVYWCAWAQLVHRPSPACRKARHYKTRSNKYTFFPPSFVSFVDFFFFFFKFLVLRIQIEKVSISFFISSLIMWFPCTFIFTVGVAL
jgi:hypothetical protein